MFPASSHRASTLGGYGGPAGRPAGLDVPRIEVPEAPAEAPPPYIEAHEDDESSSRNTLQPSMSRLSNGPGVSPESRPTYTLNGKQMTTPLVTEQAVLDHLRLLSSFWQLKQDLVAHKQPELENAGITDEDRWSIFLVKAHLRFIVWLNCRTCEPEHCASVCASEERLCG